MCAGQSAVAALDRQSGRESTKSDIPFSCRCCCRWQQLPGSTGRRCSHVARVQSNKRPAPPPEDSEARRPVRNAAAAVAGYFIKQLLLYLTPNFSSCNRPLHSSLLPVEHVHSRCRTLHAQQMRVDATAAHGVHTSEPVHHPVQACWSSFNCMPIMQISGRPSTPAACACTPLRA